MLGVCRVGVPVDVLRNVGLDRIPRFGVSHTVSEAGEARGRVSDRVAQKPYVAGAGVGHGLLECDCVGVGHGVPYS